MGLTLDEAGTLSHRYKQGGRVVCDTDRFEMNPPTCAFRRRVQLLSLEKRNLPN